MCLNKNLCRITLSSGHSSSHRVISKWVLEGDGQKLGSSPLFVKTGSPRTSGPRCPRRPSELGPRGMRPRAQPQSISGLRQHPTRWQEGLPQCTCVHNLTCRSAAANAAGVYRARKGGCKRNKTHLSSLLPVSVVEKTDRKQLEIHCSVSRGSLRSRAKGRRLSPEGGAKSRPPREPQRSQG